MITTLAARKSPTPTGIISSPGAKPIALLRLISKQDFIKRQTRSPFLRYQRQWKRYVSDSLGLVIFLIMNPSCFCYISIFRNKRTNESVLSVTESFNF